MVWLFEPRMRRIGGGKRWSSRALGKSSLMTTRCKRRKLPQVTKISLAAERYELLLDLLTELEQGGPAPISGE